jgi:translation initiation factor IF-3
MSEELKSVYDILRSIDRKTQSLVTVVPASDGVPPICKIMDKKFLRDQEKSQRKSKTSAPTVKTIELNWAVDKNDLAHRLKKMKEFLRKGYKVEVVLAGKKKGRKATEEEAKDLVKKIKEAVAEVEGARENKPVEGKMLVQATYYFEGPKQKKKKEEVVVEGGKSEVKDQLGRRE